MSRDEAVSLSFVTDCPHIFRSEYVIPSLFHLPQDKLRQVQYCFLFVFRSKEMLFAGCNMPSQFLHFIRDFCYRDERKKLQMFVYKRNGLTLLYLHKRLQWFQTLRHWKIYLPLKTWLVLPDFELLRPVYLCWTDRRQSQNYHDRVNDKVLQLLSGYNYASIA